MKNIFFDYLSWVTKSTDKKPELPQNILFMSNRWLSMASKSIAQIVNMTTNKWNITNTEIISNFYRCVIPKHTKRIEYIKKPNKEIEEDEDNIEYMSSLLEISKKELENYNNTLAELGLLNK